MEDSQKNENVSNLKWVAKVQLIHNASQEAMLPANEFNGVNQISFANASWHFWYISD